MCAGSGHRKGEGTSRPLVVCLHLFVSWAAVVCDEDVGLWRTGLVQRRVCVDFDTLSVCWRTAVRIDEEGVLEPVLREMWRWLLSRDKTDDDKEAGMQVKCEDRERSIANMNRGRWGRR